MKIYRTYEKRAHGGVKPTWRPILPYYPIGAGLGVPITHSLRKETNRQIKKQRLEFKYPTFGVLSTY